MPMLSQDLSEPRYDTNEGRTSMSSWDLGRATASRRLAGRSPPASAERFLVAAGAGAASRLQAGHAQKALGRGSAGSHSRQG